MDVFGIEFLKSIVPNLISSNVYGELYLESTQAKACIIEKKKGSKWFGEVVFVCADGQNKYVVLVNKMSSMACRKHPSQSSFRPFNEMEKRNRVDPWRSRSFKCMFFCLLN